MNVQIVQYHAFIACLLSLFDQKLIVEVPEFYQMVNWNFKLKIQNA